MYSDIFIALGLADHNGESTTLQGTVTGNESAIISSLTHDTVTPRRKNLAATVLKYGEEISAKNQVVADLERKLAICESKERQESAANSGKIVKLEDKLLSRQQ